MEYPIIILHGWEATKKSYEQLKPLLEQKGNSVVVFDLPGFGSEPAPSKEWSVDDYADWTLEWIGKNALSCYPERSGSEVKDLIDRDSSPSAQNDRKVNQNDRKEEGCEKFVLFGHSFGGRIAIKIAARQPKELAGLILCDAAGVTPRPKIKIALFNFLTKTGNAIFSLPLLNFLRPLVRKLVYWWSGDRDYYYLRGDVMRKTFRIVIEEDLNQILPKINTPTLIIWGEKDKMTPLSDAHTLNEGIGGSLLEVLRGVGHNPHREVPEQLAAIIDKFIKELD
ncbi:MAG: alpha/beta hydrolase [Candidatus Portnoybacteria bacterium]|nr:alpha/beta hydrolase [Candidatus Portnoybacteria bacterium]